MRGRSSLMEITEVNEAKQESGGLSSAYIRTLVKHLTSKDSIQSDGGLTGFVTQNAEWCSDENKTVKHKNIPTQPRVHKKQVRRRLHTSRPYQERLLNMAEARREIVTALKFHRASMKQQELASTHNLDNQSSAQEKKQTKSRKIQTLYPSSNTAATTATNSSLSCPSPPPPPPPYWPISTLVPPPPPSSSYHDNQDFILPSQTLGLNLNIKNFDNLDHPNLYHKPLSVYSTSSSSSSSTSSTPSSSSSAALYSTPVEKPNSSSSSGLHHAIMDDEEMEEIRSLGEQHQIEWNDTINLVTSARWCSFLKTMEIEAEEEGDEYDMLHRFDQSMEFPPWLNDTSCMKHLDDHFSDAYLQDSVLPCMDIGEIEAMDAEWLA